MSLTNSTACHCALVGPQKEMADGAASTCLTLAEVENELREVTAADWFSLGVQLGIRPAKLREIEKDHPGDVQRCKTEVLNWWHRNALEISWEKLAETLLKMGGYATLAQRLRKNIPSVMEENHVTSMRSTNGIANGETSSQQSLAACNGNNGIYSMVKADPLATSKQFQDIDEEELIIETHDVRCEFNILLTKVRRFLMTQGVSVRDFVLFLKKMPGYAGKSLFETEFSKLCEASDLVDVFEIVGDYCSWFNHSFLGQVIKTYCEGNKKIEKAHKDFCVQLQRYCKHRVKKCPLKNGFGSGGKKDAKMVMKVDREWDDIRIEQVEEVLFNVAQILNVRRYLLKLSSVEQGCVQLTVLVPGYIPDAMFPLTAEQEAALIGIGVTDLQCESYHFCFQEPIEMPDVNTVTAQDEMGIEVPPEKVLAGENDQSKDDHEERRQVCEQHATLSLDPESISHPERHPTEGLIKTLDVDADTVQEKVLTGENDQMKISLKTIIPSEHSAEVDVDHNRRQLSEQHKALTFDPESISQPEMHPRVDHQNRRGYFSEDTDSLVRDNQQEATQNNVAGGDERHSSHRQRFRKHFRQHFSSFVNRLTCGLSRGITNAITLTRRNEHEFYSVIETQPSHSTPEEILSELPFFGDNMSEFFQDENHSCNPSTKSSDTYYLPKPFPHVTGSQQNLPSSQVGLPLRGSEMHVHLHPPLLKPISAQKELPTEAKSISGRSQCSDYSHRSTDSAYSSIESQPSQHSNHSQCSVDDKPRHWTFRQHSSNNYSIYSHHSNQTYHVVDGEPHIPTILPFPKNSDSSSQLPLPSHLPLQQQISIPHEIIMTVLKCLMHRENCQIHNCPCKLVQERYQELCRQHPSYHPHQHAAETCRRECGPNINPGERKHQLHLNLSSQDLASDTHPHYHLTTNSHIHQVVPRPLKRQRSRSVDLTPIHEIAPEFSADDEGSVADGSCSDPVYNDSKPLLLREISVSADNIPALCLNDCPLTPTPMKASRTLVSSSMHERPTQLSMPKMTLKTVKENQTRTESSETNKSSTSSRYRQKQMHSPIPPNPNRYKKVMSEGESGYDSNVETPPGWYEKVTSLGESGYYKYKTQSKAIWNPNTGLPPRKAQAMEHLPRQSNLVLSSHSVEVTETLC